MGFKVSYERRIDGSRDFSRHDFEGLVVLVPRRSGDLGDEDVLAKAKRLSAEEGRLLQLDLFDAVLTIDAGDVVLKVVY